MATLQLQQKLLFELNNSRRRSNRWRRNISHSHRTWASCRTRHRLELEL